MNIFLRDSKGLQDFLLKASNRNALPKAQLHPELLAGRVDAEAGGFVLASDNPIDVRNLAAFMPEGQYNVSATWHLSGPPHARIPHELTFAFETGAKLVLRTQAVSDVTKLTSVIPSDRTGNYSAVVEDGRITFIRPAISPKPTSERSEADLQIEAAKAGVKWDKKASRETMIERINEAKKPATVTA